MEGFQYIDIFATKGVEYIAVIVFLIGLIFFWRWLNRPVVETAVAHSGSAEISLVDWFRMANDYSYHQGHSWAIAEKDNIVRVGIDDFAQKLLGKADRVTIPAAGTQLEQGSEGVQLRIKDKTFHILAPVGGEIIEVNQNVIDHPEIINQDPYNAGWLFKVKSACVNQQKKNLLTGNLARIWFEDTVNALSRMISKNYGVVLQDGGTIISGFVRDLSSEGWDTIARQFLLNDDVR